MKIKKAATILCSVVLMKGSLFAYNTYARNDTKNLIEFMETNDHVELAKVSDYLNQFENQKVQITASKEISRAKTLDLNIEMIV